LSRSSWMGGFGSDKKKCYNETARPCWVSPWSGSSGKPGFRLTDVVSIVTNGFTGQVHDCRTPRVFHEIWAEYRRGAYTMKDEEELYRALQVHLDEQTVGFPATKSGSDVRLLKQLFTVRQAELAMMLTHRYESVEQIYERAKDGGESIDETEHLLDELATKGSIGHRRKDGAKQYRNIPYVVGMYEGILHHRSTPDFISAHTEYSEEGLFSRAFLRTKVPQMRTIPVGRAITIEHHVGTYDTAREIIQKTADPIVILECVCRNAAEEREEPCKQTSRKETCMVFRDAAKNFIRAGKPGRQITKEEALEILKKNEEDGLVLQPSNAQTPDFMCSCCGCCCGILKLHKAVSNPARFWATNFYAHADPGSCTGCGSCVARCQTGAIKLHDQEQVSVVSLARCLGCGLCVASCPTGAIELRKKETEVVPPCTQEEMMEIIMTNKRPRPARGRRGRP
jgi:Na+-translocating ferredoxin:NAD+ oxidoreductase subunit B